MTSYLRIIVPLALYNGYDVVKLSVRILTTVTYHATLFVLIRMPLSFVLLQSTDGRG